MRRSDDFGAVVRRDVVGEGAVVHDVVGAVAFRRVVAVGGLVDGELVEVYPEAVALRVAVGEEADLEDCGEVLGGWEAGAEGMGCLLGSGLICQPGTMSEGLKATCSTSEKKLTGFWLSVIFPNGMRGKSVCEMVLVASKMFVV